MIRNSLRHIIEGTSKAVEDFEGIGAIPSAESLYQFKITLIEWAGDFDPRAIARSRRPSCPEYVLSSP